MSATLRWASWALCGWLFSQSPTGRSAAPSLPRSATGRDARRQPERGNRRWSVGALCRPAWPAGWRWPRPGGACAMPRPAGTPSALRSVLNPGWGYLIYSGAGMPSNRPSTGVHARSLGGLDLASNFISAGISVRIDVCPLADGPCWSCSNCVLSPGECSTACCFILIRSRRAESGPVGIRVSQAGRRCGAVATNRRPGFEETDSRLRPRLTSWPPILHFACGLLFCLVDGQPAGGGACMSTRE